MQTGCKTAEVPAPSTSPLPAESTAPETTESKEPETTAEEKEREPMEIHPQFMNDYLHENYGWDMCSELPTTWNETETNFYQTYPFCILDPNDKTKATGHGLEYLSPLKDPDIGILRMMIPSWCHPGVSRPAAEPSDVIEREMTEEEKKLSLMDPGKTGKVRILDPELDLTGLDIESSNISILYPGSYTGSEGHSFFQYYTTRCDIHGTAAEIAEQFSGMDRRELVKAVYPYGTYNLDDSTEIKEGKHGKIYPGIGEPHITIFNDTVYVWMISRAKMDNPVSLYTDKDMSYTAEDIYYDGIMFFRIRDGICQGYVYRKRKHLDGKNQNEVSDQVSISASVLSNGLILDELDCIDIDSCPDLFELYAKDLY